MFAFNWTLDPLQIAVEPTGVIVAVGLAFSVTTIAEEVVLQPSLVTITV